MFDEKFQSLSSTLVSLFSSVPPPHTFQALGLSIYSFLDDEFYSCLHEENIHLFLLFVTSHSCFSQFHS